MKLFNIDLHISVIADLKRIFTDVGHEVQDLCLSGHHWVMNRKKDCVKELSDDRYVKFIIAEKYDEFYEAHKKSLMPFDGFIATYPPIFARLYNKWKKPIILHAPIRYDFPIHGSPELLTKWNNWIKETVASGRLKLLGNSKYECEYMRITGGHNPKHIPSLCEYFPKRDKRNRNGFVLYEQGNSLKKFVPEIKDRNEGLPHGWEWPQIHNFKAVIHLPYQVSTMSVFEHYTANIPMIFPSPKFLADMYFCGKWKVLGQVATSKRITKSILPIQGDIDPNNYNSRETVEQLWLKNADFYDREWMREILYFDNMEELKHICNTTDFELVSEKMRIHNEERKAKVYSLWKDVFNEIES